jgi:hypothetical protein
VAAGIAYSGMMPSRPQSNGKAEGHNRTMPNEWANARPYRSEVV